MNKEGFFFFFFFKVNVKIQTKILFFSNGIKPLNCDNPTRSNPYILFLFSIQLPNKKIV